MASEKVFVPVVFMVSVAQVKEPETVCAVPFRLIDAPLKLVEPPANTAVLDRLIVAALADNVGGVPAAQDNP
ncbi:MAG: hypothetical protein WC455_15715 [Dehalococcoidia bacterium]